MNPDQIRAARQQLNLKTPTDLARMMGYDPRTVQYWEAGKNAVPEAARRFIRCLVETGWKP